MVLPGLSIRARGEKALSLLEFTLGSRNLKDVLWLSNPNERIGKLVGLHVRGRAVLVSNTLRTIQLCKLPTGWFHNGELGTPCILLRVADQVASK